MCAEIDEVFVHKIHIMRMMAFSSRNLAGRQDAHAFRRKGYRRRWVMLISQHPAFSDLKDIRARLTSQVYSRGHSLFSFFHSLLWFASLRWKIDTRHLKELYEYFVVGWWFEVSDCLPVQDEVGVDHWEKLSIYQEFELRCKLSHLLELVNLKVAAKCIGALVARFLAGKPPADVLLLVAEGAQNLELVDMA